jgi:hypothetical protein
MMATWIGRSAGYYRMAGAELRSAAPAIAARLDDVAGHYGRAAVDVRQRNFTVGIAEVRASIVDMHAANRLIDAANIRWR